MPNRARTVAVLRLVAGVVRAVALFALLVSVLSIAWLAPFLWLAFGADFIKDPEFRFIILLNLLMWWGWSQRLTWSDIKAIRKTKRIIPRPEWSVEIPAATQPWASQLIESVESRCKPLRGRLELCLSFVPGVEYQQPTVRSSGKWRMAIGISTIAFVSSEELNALLLSAAVSRFHPAARFHFFLSGLFRKAERAKSTLPTGAFSRSPVASLNAHSPFFDRFRCNWKVGRPVKLTMHLGRRRPAALSNEQPSLLCCKGTTSSSTTTPPSDEA